MDINTGKVVNLKRDDFEKRLAKIKRMLDEVLDKVDTIGNGKYKLNTIELSVGVSVGWLVLTVEGV